MPWHQNYHLLGMPLEFSALLATLPVAAMFLLLGMWRRPAWQAAGAGLVLAAVIAVVGAGMPPLLAGGAALYGAAFALFPITWIIFWALVLFRLTAHCGMLAVMQRSLSAFTRDPRLQALLIGYAFAGFLEGAAGFGTPVAIAASLLIGLGFSPWSAAAVCLLANTAPVAFGSIGIPVITLAGTTGLALAPLSRAVAALCLPFAVLMPLYLLAALGGRRLLKGVVLPAVLCGAGFGSVQFAVAMWSGPQLADLLAAVVTVAVLFVYCRVRRNAPVPAEAFAPFKRGHGSASPVAEEVPCAAAGNRHADLTPRAVLTAWLPYILLVGTVLLWNLPAMQRRLASVTVLLHWPGLDGHVLRTPPVVAAPVPYAAVLTLNWAAAAGTACMVAALLTAVLFRVPLREGCSVLRAVLHQVRLPTATVALVLALAFLMNYSGLTATLGLALAATGRWFPFCGALLGWLGVFLTGSDTSANALFGNLQVVTAERLHLSPVLMAAVNSTGGVMGKMISLQTLAVAAAATGMTTATQSRLFRFTLRHSLFLTALVGVLALACSASGWL